MDTNNKNISGIPLFKPGPGTRDLGHEYEHKTVAFQLLKSYQQLDEFWICSNIDRMIPFDDLVVCTKEKNKNVAYLFQVKHSENRKPLKVKNFKQESSSNDEQPDTHKSQTAKIVNHSKTATSLKEEKNTPKTEEENAQKIVNNLETDKEKKKHSNIGMSPRNQVNANNDPKLSILEFYKKFQKIQNNINDKKKPCLPEEYKPDACKFIIFTNRPIETDLMFIRTDEKLFNTDNGEVYALNPISFCKSDDVEFCNFLSIVRLYVNQGNMLNLQENIRSCMKEILQKSTNELNITDDALNNYINFIQNWIQIPNSKLGFKKELLRDLLEFSVLECCSLSINISNAIKHEICNFLWEDIKNNYHYVSKSCQKYLEQMISQDIKNLKISPKDMNLIGSILFKNYDCKNNSPIQKYHLHCFFHSLPFIVNNKLLTNLNITQLKYIPFGSDEDSPKNFLQIVNKTTSRLLLKQIITLNCGRKVQLFKILNVSLEHFSKLSVSEVITAFNRDYNEIKNKDIIFERKIKAIFLKIEVLKMENDDLFIINIADVIDKQTAVAIMNLNENDVCTVNNYDVKFKYLFITDDEELRNFKILDLRNIHYVGIVKGNSEVIKWLGSTLNVNQIKRFQVDLTNNDIEENNLIPLTKIHNYFHQRFLIISGVPGIGKTIAMQQIARSAPSNMFVLHVDLKSEVDLFKRLKNTKLSNSAVYLNHFYKIKDGLLREIFNIKLKNKEMLILFDGFDEIAPTFTKVVSDLIKLVRLDNYEVILTTRNVLQNQIENTFSTFSISLCPFDENEQHKYLKTYFENNNKSELTDDKIKAILDQIESQYTNSFKFCGIPLHINLIANFLLKDFDNTKRGNINLLNLYKQYTNDKLDIHTEKIKNHMIDIATIENYHKYFGIKALLHHTDQYNLIKDDVEKIISIFIESLKKGGDRIGLLISDVDDVFVHRTIAEYYVAKWLFDLFNKNDSSNEKEFALTILKCEIFKTEFITMKLFLDLMMNENFSLHEAILNNKFSYVKQMIVQNSSEISKLNNTKQTLLHTLISSCSIDETSYDLQKELLYLLHNNYDCILTSKDAFNLSPIDYANIRIKLLKNNSNKESTHFFAIYNMLFDLMINDIKSLVVSERFTEIKSLLDTPVDEYGNNLLHWAVKNNKSQFISELLPHYVNFSSLLLTRDQNGNTPILNAVKFGHLDIVKSLIEKMPKLNAHDQDIAVIYAAIGNFEEVINFLLNTNHYKFLNSLPVYIAFKKSNVTILEDLLKPNKGRVHKVSPLHYASSYKTKFVVESVMDLDSKNNSLNVSHLNISPKYLKWLNQTIEVNAEDNSGQTPLMRAVKSNNLVVVKYLISKNADLECKDKNGLTCIHYAVESAALQTLKFLCQNDIDINLKNNSGFTPLHLAVIKKNFEVIKVLIDNKAKLDCVDSSGRTCLHHAAEYEDKNIINLLCENNPYKEMKEIYGKTCLHVAIEHGNFATMKLLIQSGVNPNSVDNSGRSSLHYACKEENIDLMKYLIPHFKNVDIKNNGGRTPLHWTVYFGKFEAMKLLISIGAKLDVVDNDGDNCLHLTCLGTENFEIVKFLAPHFSDVDAKNKVKGRSALQCAVFFGKFEAIKYLTVIGANPNVTDNDGENCLHLACACNVTENIDVIKHLIPSITDVNAKNNGGQTPLHWAVYTGKLETIKELLLNGADPNAIDERGVNCMHWACSGSEDDSFATMQLLIESGVDPTSRDNGGRSSLHYACRTDNIDLIKYLHEFFDDVNIKNNGGRTPLHNAIFFGKFKVVKYLISNGANINLVDDDGDTCLHFACNGKENIDVIKYLIPRFQDINLKNNIGETPLQLAIKFGKTEISEFLKMKGGTIK